MNLKVLTIVGARPQFIKAAVVSLAIKKSGSISEVIIHTGQHYDSNMSDIFFEELGIPEPSHQLNIGSGGHGEQTGKMLERIEVVIKKEQPDMVLIYGDTNSTLAGALAASKLHIPVAHVESGLRSFNKKMPEEINRIVSDHVSDLLFAPTNTAVQNLINEGIDKGKIHLVGDVMYDAAIFFGQKADSMSDILNKLSLNKDDYILVTIHRAENTDHPERIKAIGEGLLTISKEKDIVLPLHPRTKKALKDNGLLADLENNCKVIDPLGYMDMLKLEKNAGLIVTDSGGVQKEAYFQKVQCVTLRDETEWVELVHSGWNKLVPPTSKEAVIKGVLDALHPDAKSSDEYYGSGDSADKIVEILEHFAP